MEEGASPIFFYWGVVQATFNIPDWKNVIYGWQLFVPAIGLAYLLGSIPFGLLITRLGGAGDIRKMGSGNIGATNVLRTGRKGLAALTLLLDGAKGFIAVWLPFTYFGPDVTFFTAIFVVIGHMFPIWLGFRGGKGVATMLGVMLGLSFASGLVIIAVWIIIALAFRYSSLAALVAVSLAPVFGYFLGSPQIGAIAFILALFVWAKHAGNIRRLISGGESQIDVSSSEDG
ncbi:MAG: glycerol-3-phosphate 1-O-acyltransferase PlsY [Alphaproteobacteria bacterium]|nr:glycerol-3-phosphate 1-O-acyltransferase PlsY [Alphaproteobacteria bacterium]